MLVQFFMMFSLDGNLKKFNCTQNEMICFQNQSKQLCNAHSLFLTALKTVLPLLMLLSSFSVSYAKTIDPSKIRYDIEGVETGVEGTFLVKVYIYTGKADVGAEEIKYAAIHGVIFRGFSRKGYGTQKPIASPEIETQKSDFFNAFWKNGDYLPYAEIVDPAAERIKTSKKKYKIGAIVSVSKDTLRKALEKAGIIKELNSGF